jgi:hypothetical protein
MVMRPHRLSRIALIVAMLALVPALAQSQGGPTGYRIDPGPDPVDQSGGSSLHDWSVILIPGLSSRSTLGALWADPSGGVYVWSTETRVMAPYGTQSARLEDGEKPPDPGGGSQSTFVTNSTLLRYDGSAFSTALQLPGETGVSVFGVDPRDVYAATNLENGGVRLYHFNGNKWRIEHLPEGVQGPAGSIAGEPGHMFFRAGNSILKEQGQGRRWTVAYVNDQLVPGNEIVFLNRDQVAAPGDRGTAVWNGNAWRWDPATQAMHLDGAWGARDAAGELHLFAAGSAPDQSGPRIWQLCETAARDLDGSFDLVFTEPTAAGLGSGIEVWGTGAHDQYAIGFDNGCGCLYCFNGVAWTEISPVGEMTIPSGLSGTARGDVWVALRDGKLVRGLRREPLATEPLDPCKEALAVARPAERVAVREDAPGLHVIAFTLTEPQDVSVSVFNVTGRCIAQLGRERLGAGARQVSWNARGVPAGLYFCRVTAGAWSGTGKVMVGR